LPLTERGRDQAARLAECLSNARVDRIYSSDLRRAVETARAIASPHGLEPVVDARLREFAFGAWEGLTWAEILASRPDLSEMGWRSARLYAPEGGEDFAAVCARVAAFFEDIGSAAPASAVIVTHAGALHAALGVLGLVDENAAPVNFFPASITRVSGSPGAWRLIDGPTPLP
jgi:broad specificity phosphatase PhoE